MFNFIYFIIFQFIKKHCGSVPNTIRRNLDSIFDKTKEWESGYN